MFDSVKINLRRASSFIRRPIKKLEHWKLERVRQKDELSSIIKNLHEYIAFPHRDVYFEGVKAFQQLPTEKQRREFADHIRKEKDRQKRPLNVNEFMEQIGVFAGKKRSNTFLVVAILAGVQLAFNIAILILLFV